MHYLAVPPSAFGRLTRGLDAHGLAEGARVVYEKPYGTSPESFRELDELVHSVLDEEQVFRIDHFLGKEGTQDLHVLRFANELFHHVWNREHVAQVQIDVPEDARRRRPRRVLRRHRRRARHAGHPPVPGGRRGGHGAAGQPDARGPAGGPGGGARPPSGRWTRPRTSSSGSSTGYRDIDGIADDSTTDTFVAARLWVDSDRWRGRAVPAAHRQADGPQRAAGEPAAAARPTVRSTCLPGHGNVLSLSLSGSGAIDIGLVAKEPGPELKLARARTTLDLKQVPGGDPLPPYVSLIHDVLTGDRSLFTTSDGLAKAWQAVAPLLDSPPEVQPYEPGSWGPDAAAELAGPQGWLLGDQPR